jgi:hypothetical protein
VKVVTLDAGEMAVAQMVASMRNAINRASKVGNSRVGPQSDYQTDLDGLVAEIAWAKWQNCWPDLSVSPRAGGADAVTGDARVDIKATRYVNGKLLAVPSKNQGDADVYVLAIVRENEVRFPGWAYADELLSDNNLTNLGHGPTYAMTQEELRPFKEAA